MCLGSWLRRELADVEFWLSLCTECFSFGGGGTMWSSPAERKLFESSRVKRIESGKRKVTNYCFLHVTVDRGDFVLAGDFVYFGKLYYFSIYLASCWYFYSLYALSYRKLLCFTNFMGNMKIFKISAILGPKKWGRLKSWKKVPRGVLVWAMEKMTISN